LTAPDPETAVEYKKGYVMRKSCIDPNGKRTKLGKRSWKMYFMTLRGMVLYCFKDEKSLRNPGAFDDLSQVGSF
jgi:PH/SEC7 domain-containing protein